VSASRVVVIGAGGHAKVLLNALAEAGVTVAGLTDANPALHGTHVLGANVLGDDAALDGFPAAHTMLVNGLGTIAESPVRRHVFERLRSRGYRFLTVVHPSAIIGREVDLAEGAQVMAGAILQPGAAVGENSLMNTGAHVDHDCVIGRHVHLAPGVTLSGDVRVGDGSHIGTGAAVIQGVRIGSGCMVGAGAVVVRDVPDGDRVSGVPARSMRR